jgi:hypothetical protein
MKILRKPDLVVLGLDWKYSNIRPAATTRIDTYVQKRT